MIRILYTNIRSIADGNYQELLVYLAHTVHQYNIVALSETWVQEGSHHLFPIDGYTVSMQARTDGRRLGGIMLYLSNNLTVVRRDNIKIVGGEVVKIDLQNAGMGIRDENIMLILVYRDCQYSRFKFIENLESIFDNCDRNTIILGDLNIDILNRDV